MHDSARQRHDGVLVGPAMLAPFFQVTLRTTAVEAARGFYAQVLGPSALEVVPLHEQAIARGARPHWLGLIDVRQAPAVDSGPSASPQSPPVDRVTAAFVQRGALPLGPKWVNPDGLEAFVVRDPGGAIVALAEPSPAAEEKARGLGPSLAWAVLNTHDVERAKANYGALFGWQFSTPYEFGDVGTLHPFTVGSGRPEAGLMCDVAGRSGVHPHWLFYFAVDSIDAAVTAVRAEGGLALEVLRLPSGERIVVCDDPQGAAFALSQRA